MKRFLTGVKNLTLIVLIYGTMLLAGLIVLALASGTGSR